MLSDSLMVGAYIVGYIFIGAFSTTLFYGINFVKYFLLAIMARMPMTRYNVLDIDFIEDGDADAILARIFWPLAVPMYALYAFCTFFTEFHRHVSRHDVNVPKWLTLSGWLSYTNRLLGFKEP